MQRGVADDTKPKAAVLCARNTFALRTRCEDVVAHCTVCQKFRLRALAGCRGFVKESLWQ